MKEKLYLVADVLMNRSTYTWGKWYPRLCGLCCGVRLEGYYDSKS